MREEVGYEDLLGQSALEVFTLQSSQSLRDQALFYKNLLSQLFSNNDGRSADLQPITRRRRRATIDNSSALIVVQDRSNLRQTFNSWARVCKQCKHRRDSVSFFRRGRALRKWRQSCYDVAFYTEMLPARGERWWQRRAALRGLQTWRDGIRLLSGVTRASRLHVRVSRRLLASMLTAWKSAAARQKTLLDAVAQRSTLRPLLRGWRRVVTQVVSLRDENAVSQAKNYALTASLWRWRNFALWSKKLEKARERRRALEAWGGLVRERKKAEVFHDKNQLRKARLALYDWRRLATRCRRLRSVAQTVRVHVKKHRLRHQLHTWRRALTRSQATSLISRSWRMVSNRLLEARSLKLLLWRSRRMCAAEKVLRAFRRTVLRNVLRALEHRRISWTLELAALREGEKAWSRRMRHKCLLQWRKTVCMGVHNEQMRSKAIQHIRRKNLLLFVRRLQRKIYSSARVNRASALLKAMRWERVIGLKQGLLGWKRWMEEKKIHERIAQALHTGEVHHSNFCCKLTLRVWVGVRDTFNYEKSLETIGECHFKSRTLRKFKLLIYTCKLRKLRTKKNMDLAISAWKKRMIKKALIMMLRALAIIVEDRTRAQAATLLCKKTGLTRALLSWRNMFITRLKTDNARIQAAAKHHYQYLVAPPFTHWRRVTSGATLRRNYAEKSARRRWLAVTFSAWKDLVVRQKRVVRMFTAWKFCTRIENRKRVDHVRMTCGRAGDVRVRLWLKRWKIRAKQKKARRLAINLPVRRVFKQWYTTTHRIRVLKLHFYPWAIHVKNVNMRVMKWGYKHNMDRKTKTYDVYSRGVERDTVCSVLMSIWVSSNPTLLLAAVLREWKRKTQEGNRKRNQNLRCLNHWYECKLTKILQKWRVLVSEETEKRWRRNRFTGTSYEHWCWKTYKLRRVIRLWRRGGVKSIRKGARMYLRNRLYMLVSRTAEARALRIAYETAEELSRNFLHERVAGCLTAWARFARRKKRVRGRQEHAWLLRQCLSAWAVHASESRLLRSWGGDNEKSSK